ncbi:MAG: hypothetical protein Hens2KO_01420 [Henriciella sp.]
MKTSNPHWTFHFQVLSRAMKELESTCMAKPDSAEFHYLRAEAPSIFAEAQESLAALRDHVSALEESNELMLAPPTAH